MDKKMKERIISVDSLIGKQVRNEVLNEFEVREKELIKKARREVTDEDIFDRYFKEIEKVNNQDFLPLIYKVLFGTEIQNDIHYMPFNKGNISNFDKDNYDLLLKLTGFINSLVSLDMYSEDIYKQVLKMEGKI